MLTQARPAISELVRQIDRKPEHHAEFPAHVERFLELLQTSWPAATWDEETDTVAYGRQVLTLTREQTREAYYRLRERHTFRPSVAEVRAVVDELVAQSNPNAGLSGAELAARTVVSMPKALPSAANGRFRQQAREQLAQLRRTSGLATATPSPVTASPSPLPTDVPIVGKLAVTRVEGRDVRGVVWSQEGDRVQIKLGNGERIWVDSIHARLEEPRDVQAPAI